MNSSTSPVDIRPDHLEIVRDILREHLPAGFRVWVFGSRAKWTTTDASDLDLAVEGPGKLDYKAVAGLEIAFEESSLPYTVDVVDLNAVSPDFKRVVEEQRAPLPPADDAIGYGWLYRPTFPRHWDRRSLYSLAKWVNGLAFRNIQFSSMGKPVIKIAEIKGGISGQTKFTQQEFDESVRVRHGDLLFSWSGQPETSIDAFWWKGAEGWLNQHIFRVTTNSDVDTTFFYYLLRYLNPNFVAIARDKQTTGLGHVTKYDLENMEVGIPSLAEQRAIARILGALDDKIELNRRMNRTLEEMARAIFQDWFVDFGPVRAKMEGREPYLPPELWDLFPDRLVDSELGEAPQGWEVRVLNDSIDILSGGTPKTSVSAYWDGDIPWYTAKDAPALSDVFALTTERSITQAGVDNSSTRVLPARTTVISARGTVGRLACLGIPMAMNQTCYGIRGAKGYPDFFTYWNVRNAVSELQARTHGTIFDTITRETFRIAETVLAPTSVARAFESSVTPLMERIFATLNASRALAAQRDALLPRLVSGEVTLDEHRGSSGNNNQDLPNLGNKIQG